MGWARLFPQQLCLQNLASNLKNDPQNNSRKIWSTITKQKPKIFKRGLQKADVVKTHGSNKKILSLSGKQKFTELKKGLKNTIQWYKKYYNY